MKALSRILMVLLISGCMAAYAQVQSTGDDIASDMQPLIETLNTDIADLRFLSKGISNAEKMDHKVLIYRQDERTFRLLADFDILVSKLV